MLRRAVIALCLLWPGLPGVTPARAAAETAGAPRETVLFPFDDQALPFNKGLILTLLPGRKSATKPDLGIDPKHPGKPVLATGGPGDPDEKRVYFMGTVLRVGDEYRMWYSGHDGSRRQICYATSQDGFVWEKPKLGLVTYKQGTQNNLVALDGGRPMAGMSALVVHDAGDPDPARRFKMIREASSTDLRAAVSADGVRWTAVNGDRDILPHTAMEPSGLVKFNGMFLLNGHGGPIPHPIAMRGLMRTQKRMSVTLVSYDFEHWSDAGHVSFRRDPVPPRAPLDFEFHRGEQVHLGASLWDRGNVLLGFYGQWHNTSNDRRDCVVDLGLIVSSDGVHFREPLPDYKIVPSFEEPDRAEPRLTQGQGFANLGDRTVVYYGIWPENDRNSPTGVRVATWPRDRLGYFAPAPDTEGAHCVSAPLSGLRSDARVFLNATHLAAESRLTVEILDERFRPLPGYAATDFIALTNKSGLRLPVAWRGRESLGKTETPVRVRVNWAGKDSDHARLYAVYLE